MLVWLGRARPPRFTISTIKNKVVVYAPAERADTLPLLLLYPYMYSVVRALGVTQTASTLTTNEGED
jgi:hypothetical protein